MKREDDDETITQTLDHVRFSFQDFFVEFLGGLVPGVLFLLLASVALVPPLDALLCGQPRLPGALVIAMLNGTKGTPSVIWVIFSMAGVLVAYVLGHLFYRQEPKKPDQESLKRITRHIIDLTSEQRILGKTLPGKIRKWYGRRWVYTVLPRRLWKWLGRRWLRTVLYIERQKVEEKETKTEYDDRLRKDYACMTGACDFPYLYLRDYLDKRGHDHLLHLVHWDPESQHADYRSKTYINLLKIRLTYHHPKKCGAVVRNEAHVRLASSTWYVARVLKRIGILTVVIVNCGIVHRVWSEGDARFASTLYVYLPAIIPPLFVFLMALYCKKKIEEVLHYQRLREVCFVLETAFTAFRDTPELLKPPFDEFLPSSTDGHALISVEAKNLPLVSRCPLVMPQAFRCPYLHHKI